MAELNWGRRDKMIEKGDWLRGKSKENHKSMRTFFFHMLSTLKEKEHIR